MILGYFLFIEVKHFGTSPTLAIYLLGPEPCTEEFDFGPRLNLDIFNLQYKQCSEKNYFGKDDLTKGLKNKQTIVK